MKCPKCQFENPEDAVFCVECGNNLDVLCPNCGSANSRTFKFCKKCGHDLRKSAEAPSIDYSQPESYTPRYLSQKILTTRNSIEGERKLVTVLFADVANYTITALSLICFMIFMGCESATLPETIVFKDIPGGTFSMGGMTVFDDAPEVSITVSPFRISETEITNGQYIEFLNSASKAGWIIVLAQQTRDPCGTYTENMVIGTGFAPYSGNIFLQMGETGGCTSTGEEEHINNRSWITFNTQTNEFELLDVAKADWPVNWVKWYGVYAFAMFYGVSLPTEAQWEYAARGGQQFEYPTDDGTLNMSKANYNGDTPAVYNPDGHSVAVGSYPPNPFGLYDMGGNVWEWCQDHYDAEFYTDEAIDPLNTTAGTDSKRVRRGGSWNYHSATLLTYARASDYENRGNNHFGFRIVKSE